MMTSHRARLRDLGTLGRMMKSDFPPQEQMSVRTLWALALRRGVEFSVYEDEGAIVGYSYAIHEPTLTLLLFLDIASTTRSKGYGSRILSRVCAAAPSGNIVLEIEPVEPDAPNAEQRARRLAFYKKNGFTPTGHTEYDGRMTYALLARGDFAPARLVALYKRLTFGRFKVEITPEK